MGKRNVSFTGHSLGGSIASLAAMKTDSEATTFNALGLGSMAKFLYGVSNKTTTKIDAYVIQGEALDYNLNSQGLGAIGNKHYLTPKIPLMSYEEYVEVNPAASVKYEVYLKYKDNWRNDMHLMNAVFKSLK